MDMGQPTGLCGTSKGYRIDSIHQAFWEIFHAESCAAEPPYTCTPMGLPAGLSASDAFMPALLYALRVDAKSHRQFIDAFATHVSCNLGTEVYDEVNAVLCHHDLRVCEAPPPAICESCGNGVREGTEACDGSDLGAESCEGLGFLGGVLACDSSCMLESSMCEAPETGLDVTGATDPGSDVTGSDTSLGNVTSDGLGSNGGSDGCQCSAGSGRRAGLALVGMGLVALVGARRRRRGGTRAAVLAAVLAGSGMQGCCDQAVATHAASADESSTTSDDGSTESTGVPTLPEWAIGIFSSESDNIRRLLHLHRGAGTARVPVGPHRRRAGLDSPVGTSRRRVHVRR
jgi:MYXO-CTERM domain-containing protein